MAGIGGALDVPELRGARLLLVEARYHASIADMLLDGARAMLDRGHCTWETVTVPGALEIPPAIALAADGFDAFVALGCVIRGETTHYDLVANESCRGIMDLGVAGRALIGNGILTVENEAQAIERADPARQDKGGHAALAAMCLIALRTRFRI
ncbi:MAG: 6,7-dimethyl-8-ribityllumazine synthase [Geminicoccaceae bacterium]|nr:6,7-dimethyl-8-ribityllumazine synthase [Geminicoccaceae bacterium]